MTATGTTREAHPRSEVPAEAGRPLTGPLAILHGVLDRPLASYYLLLASIGLLVVIGMVMVFSATSVEEFAKNGNAFASVARQLLSGAVGLVAFWICQRLPVRTGVQTMLGQTVEALTPIDATSGKIFIEGEYWNAVSDSPIEAGKPVEVVSVQGLAVKVKPKAA